MILQSVQPFKLAVVVFLLLIFQLYEKNMRFITKDLRVLWWLHGKNKSNEGFTLLEIMIVLLLAGIMAAMSAPYVTFGINPLPDTTNRIASNFKLVRARAIGQTSAYRISQTSLTRLTVERARTCFDTTWTVDSSFTEEDLNLNEAEDVQGLAKDAVIQMVTVTNRGTSITPLTSWTLCYNSRGIADKNLIFTLRDTKTNQQRRIEAFAGGGIQVYEN